MILAVLLGGSATAIGSLIGAFVVATLSNGLVMMGAQATKDIGAKRSPDFSLGC